MNSDGVVRFLSGPRSAGESAQVQLPHGLGKANRRDRLKDALASVRFWRVLLAGALLLTFLLALSSFIMALIDNDQATTPPTTTAGQLGARCNDNVDNRSVATKVMPISDFAGVEAECERTFKGSLVSVHDERENAFFAKFVRTSHAAEKEFYIGLTRNFTGRWIWLDGSALSYTAWKPNEPSGNSTSDHCVQVTTDFGQMNGRWDVVGCGNQRPAVCKRVLTKFGELEEEPFTSCIRTTTDFNCPDGYKCGRGTISSPDYPSNYSKNKDVTYHLMAASTESVVVLTFARIETEARLDYVRVYDGAQLDERVLKT